MRRRGVVLGLGQRVSECASVEKDREPALAKEGLQLAATWMKTIRVVIAVDGRNRQDRALRNRQRRRSDGGVIIVLRGNGRNDQVIRVVAAAEKDANQRFVIVDIGLRDSGVHESQVANGRSHRSRPDGGAGSLPDEVASAKGGVGFFFHKNVRS